MDKELFHHYMNSFLADQRTVEFWADRISKGPGCVGGGWEIVKTLFIIADEVLDEE